MTYSDDTLAVVAFSFGLRAKAREPNPCNRRLARAAERITRLAENESGNVLLISQWEVAEQLKADGVHVDRVIHMSPRGDYLDSDKVWAQALSFLQGRSVTRVIPVAQPFLQAHKVCKLIRKSGLPLERKRIGWIGFDSSPANTQWWTKGPMRLLAYALMQALGRQTKTSSGGIVSLKLSRSR
jgi:hypothetical protein